VIQRDLGRLDVLLGDLAGDGAGLTISPIYELRTIIGGIEDLESHGQVVGAWEVRFEVTGDSYSYRGRSVAEAVEGAFADQPSWR
jgi:hypothetical protein